MVERHDHVGLDHALEIVVGRHDHVIAGIAGLELGEQFVIVGEEIHLGLDAGRLLEIGQRGLADIGIPVVEIEFLLLLRQREARQEGQARRAGAGALQKGAAAGRKRGRKVVMAFPLA